MIELAIAVAVITVSVLGYLRTRRFVRERLRYVDAAQRPAAPFVAGLLTVAIAVPIVWLVPFVGFGAAALLGIGVGAGVAAGARDVRRMRTEIAPSSWSVR